MREEKIEKAIGLLKEIVIGVNDDSNTYKMLRRFLLSQDVIYIALHKNKNGKWCYITNNTTKKSFNIVGIKIEDSSLTYKKIDSKSEFTANSEIIDCVVL